MTGFGAGRARVGDEEISVELRSVNHKFCEVKARLPRELASLEPALLKAVKDRLSRGAIDVTLKRSGALAGDLVPKANLALARAYRDVLSEIARAIGTSEPPTLRDVAAQSGVLQLEERSADVEKAGRAATEALEAAIAALIVMREIEGRAIDEDLTRRLAKIEAEVDALAKLAPRAVDLYRDRLNERIAELLQSQVDPQRLAQEVAFFAERTDVAEELTRLKSHLAQFRALIASDEPAGRRMDFLVQEMHREVNTTGSKSQHPDISARVVELKAELERIREQVQNVE
jgi:uncharacterized protein (TIGR00255 family)